MKKTQTQVAEKQHKHFESKTVLKQAVGKENQLNPHLEKRRLGIFWNNKINF